MVFFYQIMLLYFQIGVLAVWGGISLNPPLNIGLVRPGDRLVFTCTTRGSNLLSWTSDDYIGHNGGTLTLATVNSVRSPNNYTNATLLESRLDNRVQVLISQLQIVAQPNFFSSSVTCRNAIAGEEQTANFTPMANPSVATDRHNVCPGDNRTFMCETRGSNTIVWVGTPYIIGTGTDGLMLSGNSGHTIATTMGKTTARIVENFLLNGVRVIRSELNITVTPDIETDLRHYITCVNYDLNTEYVLAIQMNDNCESTSVPDSTTVKKELVSTSNPPTSLYTTTEDGDIRGEPDSAESSDVSISTAVLIAVIIVIASLLVVVLVVIVIQYEKRLKSLTRKATPTLM